MDEENEKDDIDRYIESIVTKRISEPEGFEKAIREALYSEKFNKRLKKRKIIRTISTACATVVLTSGVAIGGYIVYEKVWKEPKQYTYQEFQNTIADTEVSEEEKKKLISEEQAKQTALEIAKNLGYENEEIESIELKQNKEENYESKYYQIKTYNNSKENLNIRIDANTGELKAIENKEVLGNQNQLENITEQEAQNISNEIFEKISQDSYKFNECKQEKVVYRGSEVTVWVAKYFKEYNEVINPYEELNIEFFKNNNKIEISSITKNNSGLYENNPEVITENEAINIAINKEKQLTDNEISGYKAEKAIRKMNEYISRLERDIKNIYDINQENNDEILRNNNMERNVWIITIIHESIENKNVEEYLKGKSKQYYVDMTTGEIIGGKRLNSYNK